MSLVAKIDFIDDQDVTSNLNEAGLELHDQLTDDADWDAEYWAIDSEYLQEYAEKLERIISRSEAGITFEALWVGEKPAKEVELPPHEFLEVVRSNKIGTKTKYIVHTNA